MKNRQPQFTIVDLLLLATLCAIGAAFWVRGRYQGWAFLTFAIYFAPLVFLQVRYEKPICPSLAVLLPICSALLFVTALCASMRHPPFMVPVGWEWPPFEDMGERAIHAFGLCVWQVFWVPVATISAWGHAVVTDRFR